MVLASWIFKLFPLGFRARGMRGRAGNEIGRARRAGSTRSLKYRLCSTFAAIFKGNPEASASRVAVSGPFSGEMGLELWFTLTGGGTVA